MYCANPYNKSNPVKMPFSYEREIISVTTMYIKHCLK